MEQEIDENTLVLRARQGDQAAWSELVALHQQGVFRMAYLKLGDRDEAEDVAQETLVRAFRRLNQFEVGRPLRPWLLAICVNLCRNRWRSLKRRAGALGRWSQRAEPSRGVQDETDASSEASQLWALIRRLKPQEQDVLYYRFFMELEIEDVAAVMDVESGTVKSRQHRALRRLRGLIQRHAPEWFEGRDTRHG
jgi:RNA polymerase sigma factor (sigma-70 family)